MAIRKTTEILANLKSKLDDTSDETLALLEDISDTLNDFETKTKDTTDWETKYKENDENWRKKYHERFFTPSDESDDIDELTSGEEEKKLTFENLFKEEN